MVRRARGAGDETKIMIKHWAVAAAALVAAGSALAEEAPGIKAGTIEVRGRVAGVLPEVSGSSISVIGGRVDASTSVEPEVDFTYFFTPHIAAELIAATTRHHITARSTALGDVDVGKVSLLPPTLTAQYHFGPNDNIDPYVGAGINYTVFFNHKLPHNNPVTSITYDNNPGAALQAGFDVRVAGNWVINVDVKHIFLDTTAKLNGGAIKADVSLDPTIVAFGVGYRF
jgi:outer membrane protein